MADLFETLQQRAATAGINIETKRATQWFREQASSLSSVNRSKLVKSDRVKTVGDFILGSMFMYNYDPKHKKKLPYYDRFPLTIIVDKAPNGFYGLNLHYLPPSLRARFLDQLLTLTNKKAIDEKTRFVLTYNMLKKSSNLKEFKPCFKHYLSSYVRSNFATVHPEDWKIAVFLPMAQFRKSSEQNIWRQSRKMIK